VARDGEAMADRLRQWQVDEELHFARDLTPERADLLVDGTGARVPEVRAPR
jgi:hypothetical protein